MNKKLSNSQIIQGIILIKIKDILIRNINNNNTKLSQQLIKINNRMKSLKKEWEVT